MISSAFYETETSLPPSYFPTTGSYPMRD